MDQQRVGQNDTPTHFRFAPGASDELADIADALECLVSRVRSEPLRDALANARTLIRAALIDARQTPLLGLAMRFLREFETTVGASPLTDDARRLRERLAPLLRPAC